MGKKAISLKVKFFIVTTIVIIVQFVLNIFLYHSLGNFEYIDQKMSKEVYSETLNAYNQLQTALTTPAKSLDREANHIAESIETVVMSENNMPLSAEADEEITFSEKFDSLSGNSPKITSITASVEKSLLSVLSDDNISGAFIILDTNVSKKENSHSALYLRKTDKGVSVIYGNNAKTSLDRTRKIADEIDFSLENEETGVLYSFYSKPALYKKKSLAHSAESFTYWSAPHRLFDGEERVVSYSRPVVSSDGTFIGVIGFEVSEKTIKSFLPADSLGFGNSGYAFFDRSNGMIDLSNAIATGASINDIETISHPIIATLDNDYGQNVSTLEAENGKRSYLYTHYLDFYDENSYFAEGEDWLLVGKVPENYITKQSTVVKSLSIVIMATAVLVSLLVSIFVISISTSKTKKLIRTVENFKTDHSKSIVLERVGIKEIDKLSEMLESYSEDVSVNSAKKSKIVDLISNPIATFEISKNEDKVFVSNSIVNILQLNPAIIINGYINKKEWEEIYTRITSSENISYEGSYHVNKEAGNDNSGQWLKINTYESDKYIIGVITDISEQILERKRIEYERNHDSLTGIINRRTFLLRTEEILGNCKNAVVALWDIKNIKFVNNKYGHENGDKLIKAATRVLDSVSNDRHTITARLSGDEFVTIFFGEKDVSFYKSEVKNLYELLSNVVIETPDGTEIKIEAAVGTACYPFDAPDIKGLLRCTDSTLLNNKNENGRHSDGIFEYKAY